MDAKATDGDAGLFERVPAGARCRQRTWKDRWRRFAYGQRQPAAPSYRSLIEDPDYETLKTGICCSGGGIRSAAFNLGALQVLQEPRHAVLQEAKYLAAVSGGSYIAAGLAMVAKTAPNPDQQPRGSDAADDSDERLVTPAFPPFYRGSPEEQYLRNRSSYLAPAGAGRARLVARIAFGLLVNLTLIASAVIATAALLALLYRSAWYDLLGDGNNGFGLDVPGAVVRAIAVVAGVGVLAGSAAAVTRMRFDRLREVLETWSLRLLLIAGLAALVLLGLPGLLAAVRNLGNFDDQSTGEGSLLGALTTTGGSLIAVLTAVLAELRNRLKEPKQVQEQASKVAKAVRSLGSRARVALTYAVTTILGPLVVLAGLFACLLVFVGEHPPWGWLLGPAAAVLIVHCVFVRDLTSWSLHPFYRRRLCTAFALKRVNGTDSNPSGEAVERDFRRLVPLSQSGVRPGPGWKSKNWPTLLVCAAANVSDEGATPPGREVTSFTFSPTAMGGPLVGGVPTTAFEQVLGDHRCREYTLATAVAISGAALSPSMGKLTRRSLRFLLALGNIRLGVWVPNPRRLEDFHRGRFHPSTLWARKRQAGVSYGLNPLRGTTQEEKEELLEHAKPKLRAPRPGPYYLVKELLGQNSIDDKHLYVSDGGHYENLGLVELLRRGCTEILCFDASGGKSMQNLGDAIALARSELEVEIEIDPGELIEDDKTGLANAAVARGTITYHHPSPIKGTLFYVRAALTKDAPYDLHAFRQTDSKFPHHSTSDQLFTDQKFEAYRELGAHTARAALKVREASSAPPAVTVEVLLEL